MRIWVSILCDELRRVSHGLTNSWSFSFENAGSFIVLWKVDGLLFATTLSQSSSFGANKYRRQRPRVNINANSAQTAL